MIYSEWIRLSRVETEKNIRGRLSWLTPDEQSHADGIKHSARRLSWLAGRLAAKRAIARFCRERHGFHVSLVDIQILVSPEGLPAIQGEFMNKFPSVLPFQISISHSGSWALCVLAKSGDCRAMGVDVEKVERRRSSWRETAFHPEEPAHASEDAWAQTRAWTVKEAVLKALGLGLSVDLHEVKWNGSGVSLSGKALARFQELGLKRVECRTWPWENNLVSLVTMN